MEKKRYLSITLAMCLVFSILSGCGGQAGQSPQTQGCGVSWLPVMQRRKAGRTGPRGNPRRIRQTRLPGIQS